MEAKTNGLVLTRLVGQWIYIDFAGQRVELCVDEVRAAQVRIRFVADRSVRIVREEIDTIPSKQPKQGLRVFCPEPRP